MKKNEVYFKRVVEEQIGYEFENPRLLQQAFTRKSYSKENGGEDNEVLEFYGDKVLDLAVVRYLYKRYGTDMRINERVPETLRVKVEHKEFKSKLAEGELTKLKQKLVQKRALAQRIDELDFARFLITGKGDKRDGAAYSDSVKEDLFEAILGAAALDCNWDSNKLQDIVETMLCPDSLIDNDKTEDYVSKIEVWCSQKKGIKPHYKYLKTEEVDEFYGGQWAKKYYQSQTNGYSGLSSQSPKDGMNSIIPKELRVGPMGLGSQSPNLGFTTIVPSDSRNRAMNLEDLNPTRNVSEKPLPEYRGSLQGTYECMNYTEACRVVIEGVGAFVHFGETKYQAKKAACKLAYTYLEKKGLLFTIKDEIDNPNLDDAINQLETLSRRGYFSLPEYEYEERYDEDGNSIWHVECYIKETFRRYMADASVKKQAKKKAAYYMLKHVLGLEEEWK